MFLIHYYMHLCPPRVSSKCKPSASFVHCILNSYVLNFWYLSRLVSLACFYDVFTFHFAPLFTMVLSQMIHMKYGTPDSELQNYAIQAMEILQGNDSPDPHALVSSSVALRFLNPWTVILLLVRNFEWIMHKVTWTTTFFIGRIMVEITL